jgi:uncharacterized protein
MNRADEPDMEIDRLAPTRRPPLTPAGYQRWRSLLFLHWTVPYETLRPLVLPALDLDVFEGRAYVGLVPFAMEGVRPRWSPNRIAFRFLETNVRTYVHVGGRDPGVYFFSLDAASRVAVAVARSRWGLPYFNARMRMERRDGSIDYHCTRVGPNGARLSVRYQVSDDLGAAEPGTLDHFLIERYLLFVKRRGHLWSGQVHHPPYPLRRASVTELHDELVAAAGLPQPKDPPARVHYSPGVDVEVFPLRPRPRGT